jgi:hypothetical protein
MARRMRLVAFVLLLCTGVVFGIAPGWHHVIAHPLTAAPTAVSVCQADDHEHDCIVCHLSNVVPPAVAQNPGLLTWTEVDKPLWGEPCEILPRITFFPLSNRAPPAV